MNRKEFNLLLNEWKDNFIISERPILQGGGTGGVLESRKLNGWLTYLTVWDPNSPHNLDKYSEFSEEFEKMWDEGRRMELENVGIDLFDSDSKYSKEFLPLAKKLGFEVKSAGNSNTITTSTSIIRISPKMGKGKDLYTLLHEFAGDEAEKILVSGCCNDDMPLFIVPFDYDKRKKIPGAKRYSANTFKNITPSEETSIFHWLIHDMWHLVPEWFTGSRFSKMAGIKDERFLELEANPENRDLASMVSFAGSFDISDSQKELLSKYKDEELPVMDQDEPGGELLDLEQLQNLEFPGLKEFLNSSGITGGIDVGLEDIGPSVFAYVLTEVESHEDIDSKMSELNEDERVFVKFVFDKAPQLWEKILKEFKNEIVIIISS